VDEAYSNNTIRGYFAKYKKWKCGKWKYVEILQKYPIFGLKVPSHGDIMEICGNMGYFCKIIQKGKSNASSYKVVPPPVINGLESQKNGFLHVYQRVVFFGGYESSSYKWIIINNPMKTSSIYRRQKPACDIGHTFAPTNRAHERNGNQPVLRWAMELVN
jgi:hypothetical protein